MSLPSVPPVSNTVAVPASPFAHESDGLNASFGDKFYVTGGTVPTDAASYVARRADEELLAGLLAGEYCYVLNTRQMGKSSLCVRTIARLKSAGVRAVFLDLTRIGSQNVTAEQWYAGLLSEAGRALNLRKEFVAYWKQNAELPSIQRFFGALREIALEQSNEPVAVFVDEIDAVRSLPFSTDEFFAAIRAAYNSRTEDDAFARLTFCLLGVATPADLITDTRLSPFNIGHRIVLRDFTKDEAAPLAQGLPGSQRDAALARVLYWTSGHPFLTQRLCRSLADAKQEVTPSDVDRLCQSLFLSRSARESDDNLSFVRNRLLRSEVDPAALLDLYRQVRLGKKVLDDETNGLCAVLRLSGVCKTEGDFLAVRNQIYRTVFDLGWIRENMPDAELRRQKAAYRRGFGRMAGASGIAFVLMAITLWSIVIERRIFSKALEKASKRLLLTQNSDDNNKANIAAIEGDYPKAANYLVSEVDGLNGRSNFDVCASYTDALLASGNKTGYQNFCGLMQKKNPNVEGNDANSVAWICILSPKALPNPDFAVHLAMRSVAKSAGSESLGTLGAALYRAGRYEDALAQLNKSNTLKHYPENDLFIAMCLWKMNQHDTARQKLLEARATLTAMEPPKSDWQTRVERQCFLQEAISLVENKKSEIKEKLFGTGACCTPNTETDKGQYQQTAT